MPSPTRDLRSSERLRTHCSVVTMLAPGDGGTGGRTAGEPRPHVSPDAGDGCCLQPAGVPVAQTTGVDLGPRRARRIDRRSCGTASSRPESKQGQTTPRPRARPREETAGGGVGSCAEAPAPAGWIAGRPYSFYTCPEIIDTVFIFIILFEYGVGYEPC